MRFEVFTAVKMPMAVFWVVTPCALMSTNVSEKHTASILRAENHIKICKEILM
jgi:hypothetical protein